VWLDEPRGLSLSLVKWAGLFIRRCRTTLSDTAQPNRGSISQTSALTDFRMRPPGQLVPRRVVVIDPVEALRRKEEKEFKARQAEEYESMLARVNARAYTPSQEGARLTFSLHCNRRCVRSSSSFSLVHP
jgi:hypothetical protein